MRTIEREIVAAMIVSRDDMLFFGKKPAGQGGVYVDYWHIPGGGVEEGESLETALRREIQEETGIDVHAGEVKLIDDDGYGESEKTLKDGEKVLCKMHFLVYRIDLPLDHDEIEIELNDDLEKSQWIKLEKAALSQVKLTPPSVELFKRLNII